MTGPDPFALLSPGQRDVLRVAGLLRGFSDEELVNAYTAIRATRTVPLARLTASSIRTRRTELVASRHLRRSPVRGITSTGRRCDLWEVVE